MKKSKILLIILLMIFPLNIYAYSDKVIVGGETIGIEVYSKGVYVVGFYEVNGKNIASDAGFKIGDIIMERIFFVRNGDLSVVNSWLQKGGRVKFIQVIGQPLHNGGDTCVLTKTADVYAYIVLEFD